MTTDLTVPAICCGEKHCGAPDPEQTGRRHGKDHAAVRAAPKE